MLEIRESRPDDLEALEALYPSAFPDEDLLPLLRALLEERTAVTSLIGLDGGVLIAHVVFTACNVTGSPDMPALLGPLAVTPGRQRQGIGRAMVQAGFRQLKLDGTTRVFVLGDPGYYGRLGFEPDARVLPPYPLPAEWEGAWQSLTLAENAPPVRGALAVPPPWRQPSLWGA